MLCCLASAPARRVPDVPGVCRERQARRYGLRGHPETLSRRPGPRPGASASAWSAEMPDVATLAARHHAHSDARASEAGLDILHSLAVNGA
jgi:hypothetical protein